MKHQRKITTITTLLFLCLFSKLCATGAGVQAGLNPGLFINEEKVKPEVFTGTLTGTFRFSRIPVAAGIGLEGGKVFDDFSYGISAFADYYAIDVQLRNTWNMYSGFGSSAAILTSHFDSWTVAAGARFFAGVNWLYYDNFLEFYAQQNIVPTCLKSLSNSDSKGIFVLKLPLEAGVRFHF